MALNFEESFIDTLALDKGNTKKPMEIPDSKNITGIELRLSKAYIIDNKTPKIPPFPGYAKMYLVVVVISDTGAYLQSLDLKSFAKVDDEEDIPIDKNIFYWKHEDGINQKAPSQIHASVSIIKSKKSLRDVGKVMSNVKNDPAYATLLDNIKEIVKSGAQVNMISNLAFTATQIVGKFLGKVDDKPLLTWVQSYSDINGDFDQLGKNTKSRKNRYAELNLSLTIRDTSREKALAKLKGVDVEVLEEID